MVLGAGRLNSRSSPAPSPRRPRVLVADRGDALGGAMSAAMRERFDVVGRLDAELSQPERLLVAAATFRPRRERWVERFYKSNLAVALRSRRARSGIAAQGSAADVVLQTHALFETSDPRTVLYVDCTHRQSMEQWPAWNPLRGRALDRWLAREHRQYHDAAHIFAFYQGTADSLVHQYGVPAERVSVVGAGVNFERLPVLRDRHTGPPTVLFVGNDFERKGGPQLLAAFELLRRRIPEARLRLVGTPTRLPAQAGVEQLGRVQGREALSALYAEADVFCLPSVYDPFPGVLLEAMAHGLPCVVTPTCGIPEIVEDGVTALSVARDESVVVALAAALERLLLDPATATRMGREGRRRVEERFTWAHVADRMAPVLERLAHQTAHPAATAGITMSPPVTTRGAPPSPAPTARPRDRAPSPPSAPGAPSSSSA